MRVQHRTGGGTGGAFLSSIFYLFLAGTESEDEGGCSSQRRERFFSEAQAWGTRNELRGDAHGAY